MPRYLLAALVWGLAASFSTPAGAIIREWDDGGAGKNWTAGNNWNPNGVPESADQVFIGNHANAGDDTVIFNVAADTVTSLVLVNGADLDINGGELLVLEDTFIGIEGVSGSTPAELFVRPVLGTALDTNTLTINDEGQLTMFGGLVSVDGTGSSLGLLSIEDGGEIFGHGTISLDETQELEFGEVLFRNRGRITVGDPSIVLLGEPPARTLRIQTPNTTDSSPLRILDGAFDTVRVRRNSTLDIDLPAGGSIGGPPGELATIFLEGNATFDANVRTQLNPDNRLWIDSGEVDLGIVVLPPAPAIVRGVERFSLFGAELFLPDDDDAVTFEVFLSATGAEINNSGTVRLEAGGRIASNTTFNTSGAGQLVNGNNSDLDLNDGADIDSPIINEGTLTVADDSEGQVTIDTLTLAESSNLSIELRSVIPGQFDRITVEGNSVLDGMLSVHFNPTFTPLLGNSFTILETTLGAVGGTFDVENLPIDNGLTLDVIYNPTSVVLEVVEAILAGDYNDDGTVNAADYTAWRDNLGLAITLPNEDATPGIVTQEDYNVWRTNFGATAQAAGAGAALVSSPVPEPGALMLLGIAAAAWAGLRPR